VVGCVRVRVRVRVVVVGAVASSGCVNPSFHFTHYKLDAYRVAGELADLVMGCLGAPCHQAMSKKARAARRPQAPTSTLSAVVAIVGAVVGSWVLDKDFVLATVRT
jgi:uncharacterized membrane protein YeaQ/YmgE (transglycosylase-associated protein family)